MRLPDTNFESRIETFFIFRFLFNAQQKLQKDCVRAFYQTKVLFYSDHGFCPYDRLDDYLLDLYKMNSDYQQLCN